MKIGVLQTGLVPEVLSPTHGQYAEMFQTFLGGQGFDFQAWSVVEGDMPCDVHEADGWLITGSRHGVYEDHAWLPPLEIFIRHAKAHGRPMVGICFGHQIMAQALGGDVRKFDGGWIVGAQEYDFADGARVTLAAWHQDQVLTPPKEARTIAKHESCAHAALLYPGWGLSFQPHPEFSPPYLEGLLLARGPGIVPDALLSHAKDRLNDHLDAQPVADQIAQFFRDNAPMPNAQTETV